MSPHKIKLSPKILKSAYLSINTDLATNKNIKISLILADIVKDASLFFVQCKINFKLPKYDVPPDDPAHIFTNEEINMILERFKNNHCVYYAFLTAYCTGLRNILKKNQVGGTKQRHISGSSTTVWYFGTCKTQTSYRTIPIGDTLVKALKEFKKEQEIHKKNYGDTYMKHYKKTVINPYNKKHTDSRFFGKIINTLLK